MRRAAATISSSDSSSDRRPSQIARRTCSRPPRGRTPRLNGTYCLLAGCICAAAVLLGPIVALLRFVQPCQKIALAPPKHGAADPDIAVGADRAGAEQFKRSRTGRSLVQVLADLVEFTQGMGALLLRLFGLWAGPSVWRQRRKDQCDSEQQLCEHQSILSACAIVSRHPHITFLRQTARDAGAGPTRHHGGQRRVLQCFT